MCQSYYKNFTIINSFNPLWGKYSYSPCFIEKEIEADRIQVTYSDIVTYKW
jgi:hypothetical protein